MPTSADPASLSDAALLLAAQAGNRSAGNLVFNRFKRLIFAMIRNARPQCRRDFIDDVRSETFRMVFDPEITRFQSARGTIKKYLFGLVKNAIRIIDRQRRPACVNRVVKPVADDAPASQRDAAVVFNNTFGCRSEPQLDTSFIERDALDHAVEGADDKTIDMARRLVVEEESMVQVALDAGVNRFALARRFRRFCDDAARRLAS